MSGRLRTVFRALFTIRARQGCGPTLPPPPPSHPPPPRPHTFLRLRRVSEIQDAIVRPTNVRRTQGTRRPLQKHIGQGGQRGRHWQHTFSDDDTKWLQCSSSEPECLYKRDGHHSVCAYPSHSCRPARPPAPHSQTKRIRSSLSRSRVSEHTGFLSIVYSRMSEPARQCQASVC